MHTPNDVYAGVRHLVVHCLGDVPYDVYIGRPSKWGNPFKGKNKPEVIAQFERWLLAERPDLVRDAKRELRGKVLGCWCKKNCHGLILAKLANPP